MNNDASWAEEECGVAVGRAVCRAKWHFALFGVLSGEVAAGRDVRRAKWHFALFAVPSGEVGRNVRRAKKCHFAPTCLSGQ